MGLQMFPWVIAISLFSYTASAAEYPATSYERIEDKAQCKILTPALSQRKTAKIRLPNGVEAYLVSDPDSEQSAAAVSMEAGSWQDPKKYPGMAHFLEHMLFMGTKAYPQESEYMQYISDHGGKVNAFTAPDRTVYMFSINHDAFEGAIDRFSHFFIDPLFSSGSIQRELLAVDQEHAKNIESDGWREYMVFKETANPAHPNAMFSTGNANTLSGIPREALIEWYETHYSADKMHLTILSSLPIEQMVEIAAEKFSSVPKREVPDQLSLAANLSSSEQQGHFIYIQPIRELRTLSLVWELPREMAPIDQKWTQELVAYALSQQSENSLLSELKREQLAESLSAVRDRYGKNDLFFRLDIQLTEQGLSQMDMVIFRCFQAIAQLRYGIPSSLFDEMKKISQIQYEYQSREDAFLWIQEVASDLIDENLDTFPEKTQIPSDYKPQEVSQLINYLQPKSCMFFVLADLPKLGIEPDRTEQWMGVNYAVKSISDYKLTAWMQANPNPKIELPPANPFIPDSLQLVDAPRTAKETPKPALIVDEEKAKIYYSLDERYLVPETSLLFSVRSPALDGSAKTAALMDLYTKALAENLSSTRFFANQAGIFSSFAYQDSKFRIAVHGYSEKAPDLVEALFEGAIDTHCSAEEFDIYKTSLLSSYANASKELPVKQAMETLSNVLFNDAPTFQDKLAALHPISYEEFQLFCKQWHRTLYIEGMMFGNLSSLEASDLWNQRLKPLLAETKPYPLEEQKKKIVLSLPADKGPYKIVEGTDRQGNGTVLLIQQGDFSFAKRASQQILSKVLKDSFFETLRTKQQTAYIAQSWDMEVEKKLMQTFAVQSSSHNPEDLLMRFEMFLEDFTKRTLEIIPEDRFQSLKKMQIATLQLPPENMSGMADRLSRLAFEYEGDFAWVDKLVEAVQALEYETLLQDTRAFLSKANQKRIAVLVEGIVPQEKQFHYQTIAKEEARKLADVQ